MSATGAIADMRMEYRADHEHFDVEHLACREPFGQFKHWFELACNTDGIPEPNAMALATATRDGKPSCRMVLLKDFNKEGFTFLTNHGSRKGREMEDNHWASLLFYWLWPDAESHNSTKARQAANPFASLLFYWTPLKRSVRIEGTVEKMSEEEAKYFFEKRPKANQVAACSSEQSSVIPSREVMMTKFHELEKEFADKDCPKPSYWGGYLLRPETFEFWQGQSTRMHDRIRFRKPTSGEELDPTTTHVGDDGWVFERLSP